MALILNIETSTNVCSVNLALNGKQIAFRESDEDKTHAKTLTIFIQEIFSEAKIEPTDLDAVAISKGPGSYTGLRIGVSTAKGLCYGGNIPLIAVSTLKAMSFGVSSNIEISENVKLTNPLFCPMIDARRLEVYSGFFDISNNAQSEINANIISDESFIDQLNNQTIYFFGNGAEKCKEIIKHENAVFIDNISTSSKTMISLSEEAYNNKEFEDVAYFEPYYLKDFVATIPKKKFF